MFNIMLIGNGFDVQHGISIKFKDFIASSIFQNGIGKRYKNFFKEENYINFSSKTELWSDFENFLGYIINQKNIKEKYFVKQIIILFQKWIESRKNELVNKNPLIDSILKENKINFLLSLNYTTTPEIYGFTKKIFTINSLRSEWTDFQNMDGKYINLHSYSKKNRKIHFIIGNDDYDNIHKNKFILEWYEKNKFNPKNLLLNQILSSKLFCKIIVYGFSFGKSDKTINDFLHEFSKNREIIIYEKNNEGEIVFRHF